MKIKDLNDISTEISKKLGILDENEITDELITIAKSPIFEFYPDKFNLILSQKNPKSQQILLEVLEGPMIGNKECISELLYYSDCPDKQARIAKYFEFPQIVQNEKIYIAMMGIEDKNVEEMMVHYFENDMIKSDSEFKMCSKKSKRICKAKSKIKSLF